jgi:hypothetical protein
MVEILRAVDFGTRLPELLERHPSVRRVSLAGSRGAGTQTPLSDWDFAVETGDFAAVSNALPELTAPLEPLAQQWDLLGQHPTYMLMLRGPVKIDLIFFDEAMTERPPWEVSAETLAAIDAHFWDWILWLAAKRAGGRDDLVGEQLEKLHGYLLRPLGVEDAPTTIEQAVEDYLCALESTERRFGVTVPRALRDEVLPALSA